MASWSCKGRWKTELGQWVIQKSRLGQHEEVLSSAAGQRFRIGGRFTGSDGGAVVQMKTPWFGIPKRIG